MTQAQTFEKPCIFQVTYCVAAEVMVYWRYPLHTQADAEAVIGVELIDKPVLLAEHVTRSCCIPLLSPDADMSTPEWTDPPTHTQIAAVLADTYDWRIERQELGPTAKGDLIEDYLTSTACAVSLVLLGHVA